MGLLFSGAARAGVRPLWPDAAARRSKFCSFPWTAYVWTLSYSAAVLKRDSDHRDLHAVDRRQRVEQAVPLLAAVPPDPQLSRRGPEVERGRFELVDVHRVAQDREEALLLRHAAGELPPRAAAILAAPDRGSAAWTGARRGLERRSVDRVRVVRMHDHRKAEIGRQPLGDRPPRVAVVVAAQHTDVRPRSSRSIPFAPAAVVLDVEASGRVRVGGDLVNALAEFGEGIGSETGADALIGRPERLAAILAQVVTAGRDAEVDPVAVVQDRVHAEPAGAGLPLPGVLVVADARNHIPGIAAIAAPEERRRLDAAPEIVLAVARLERPDVDERR